MFKVTFILVSKFWFLYLFSFIMGRLSIKTFREQTRVSKHQKKMVIPDKFTELIKEYAKHIIRQQPEDILKYSEEYFKSQVQQISSRTLPMKDATDGTLKDINEPVDSNPYPLEHPLHNSVNIMVNILKSVVNNSEYQYADPNLNNCIHMSALKEVLINSFECSEVQVTYLLSSNTVTYKEVYINYVDFTHAYIEVILYFQQNKETFIAYNTEAEGATVHGYTKSQIFNEVSEFILPLDENNTGILSLDTFKYYLAKLPLQLSRRDIQVIILRVDISTEGFVYINDEINKLFDNLLLAHAFDEFDHQYLS